jgi:hypothetical protein
MISTEPPAASTLLHPLGELLDGHPALDRDLLARAQLLERDHRRVDDVERVVRADALAEHVVDAGALPLISAFRSGVRGLAVLAVGCAKSKPLPEAILGSWEVLCYTDTPTSSCLSKEKDGLRKTFQPGGALDVRRPDDHQPSGDVARWSIRRCRSTPRTAGTTGSSARAPITPAG